MNTNFYAVYDFETICKNGEKATNPLQAEPIQVAARILHPRKLEFVEGGTFSSYIKPPYEREELHMETVAWHAKNADKKPEDLIELWYNAPAQNIVWGQFIDFLNKYHGGVKKGKFSAPVLAGHNIISYDNIIFSRMCVRYNFCDKNQEQNVVLLNKCTDTLHLLAPWFENNPEIHSLSLDKLRPYLGLSSKGSHDAFKDVNDCSLIMRRFLRFHRALAENKSYFKGSFSGESIDE